MSLPAKWVDALFTKLTLAYGRDFLARWEGLDICDVKTDWGHELAGFVNHPEAIAYALANLPPKAPTVLEFRALCRRAPVKDAPRLESPAANPERVRAELAKLGDLRGVAVKRVGGRDWAQPIIDKAERGERVSPTVLRMARQAKGMAA